MSEENKKTYVLDTNVILQDPEAIFKFEENTIILPITIIEEADKFKGEQSELGRNSRQFSRNLKELRKLGKLNEGVPLEGGGTLRVEVALSQIMDRLPLDLNKDIPDNRILAVAVHHKGILITNDSNLSIKAEGIGVPSEEYKNSAVRVDEFYTGTGKGYVTEENLSKIYADKKLELSEVTLNPDVEPFPHQYFTLHSMCDEKHSAIARYDAVMKEFKLLPGDLKLMGIVPKTKEQQFSMDALLDPSIPLVTLTGPAGTSKSFSALWAALYQVLETKQYSKIMILKPIISLDNSNKIGYRKGDFMEKMAPWVSSYSDNISVIMGITSKDPEVKIKTKTKKRLDMDDKEAGRVSMMQELMSYGIIEVGDLETMRGRSLPGMFIILDETQSCSKHLLKSVITRLAEGSKICVCGDLEQIDLPWITAETSGLTHVVEKFKGDKLAAHVHLTKSVRSEIAERAAEIL